MTALTPPGLTIRAGGDADWQGMSLLLETCFGERELPETSAVWQSMIPEGAVVVACDGADLVGSAWFYDFQLTLPGGAVLPAAGVAGVAVAPTHRRRGTLRAMFAELDRRMEQAGYPLAVLTASEGDLYGRFGYGAATADLAMTVHRRHARFHPAVPDPGGVRIAQPIAQRDRIQEIYQRWRLLTPGGLWAPEQWWNELFADWAEYRDGGTPLMAMLHDDGFVLYRVHRGDDGRQVRINHFAAVTDDAYIALWRALLGLDLMDTITVCTSPEDPLPHLLTNARLVHTASSQGELWLRIHDVCAVLAARDYGADGSVVFELADAPGTGPRYALAVQGGRAQCVPTTAPAEVHTDRTVLSGILLGAHRPSAFAAVKRLRCDPTVLPRLDAMFAAHRPAQLGYHF